MVRITSGRPVATGASPLNEAAVEEAAAADTILPGWLEGLRLICTDLSDRQYPETLQWVVLLVLEALQDEDPAEHLPQVPAGYALHSQVQRAVTRQDTLRAGVHECRLSTWLAPP